MPYYLLHFHHFKFFNHQLRNLEFRPSRDQDFRALLKGFFLASISADCRVFSFDEKQLFYVISVFCYFRSRYYKSGQF